MDNSFFNPFLWNSTMIEHDTGEEQPQSDDSMDDFEPVPISRAENTMENKPGVYKALSLRDDTSTMQPSFPVSCIVNEATGGGVLRSKDMLHLFQKMEANQEGTRQSESSAVDKPSLETQGWQDMLDRDVTEGLNFGRKLLLQQITTTEARATILPQQNHATEEFFMFPQSLNEHTQLHAQSRTSKKESLYTAHQAKSWHERFNELRTFKRNHGHCGVPSSYPSNPALAQWVKRQRSQWKLKRDGRHSNMSNDREAALEDIGFIWDAHSASWMERFDDLRTYAIQYGHAKVPSRFPDNPQLAVWCKCQRRQFKLYVTHDKRSTMTKERIRLLRNIGFEFNPQEARRRKICQARF